MNSTKSGRIVERVTCISTSEVVELELKVACLVADGEVVVKGNSEVTCLIRDDNDEKVVLPSWLRCQRVDLVIAEPEGVQQVAEAGAIIGPIQLPEGIESMCNTFTS